MNGSPSDPAPTAPRVASAPTVARTPSEQSSPTPTGTSGRQGRPGLLARVRSRFLLGAEDIEAAELQDEAARSGAAPVTSCMAGQQVVVAGTVRSLTLRPRAGVPALEAELYDGSARILLIWLGRRQIRGIEPGRSLVAHGRVTRGRDSLVIYNPSYELRPMGNE